MTCVRINSAPIVCLLSNLTAFTTDPTALETIVGQEEPLRLRVTVEFERRSGAIALMPLAIPIRVSFFAKPFGPGETIDLGTAMTTTTAGVFTYTPTLELDRGPGEVGLVPEVIYNVSALLRIGAVNHPALLNGFIEHLAIQVYCL